MKQEHLGRQVHVEADLTLLPPGEGGRHTPIASGYHGSVCYEGGYWDAMYDFPDGGSAAPGTTTRALLHLTNPAAHHGRLKPGSIFEVREGSHLVGIATVRAVHGLA